MFTQTSTTETHIRHKWILNQAAFDRLLAKMGPDRETAGKAYEEMRERLIRYFRPAATQHAEQWADVVLDRVAKKNEDVDIANMTAFVWGVARVVRTEMSRKARRHITVELTPDLREPARSEEEFDKERRAEWVTKLAQRAPRAECELLLGWYSCYAKSAQRRQLAVSLGISVASLRVKAHRARVRLRRLALREGV